MYLNAYQHTAMRTAIPEHQKDGLVLACLGLSGEVGEFVDHVKKAEYHGHPLDTKKLIKELGDVLWYVALAATNLGVELGEVAWINIDKLRERYPDGFSSERSITRVKEQE